jgi:hypothetical protein
LPEDAGRRAANRLAAEREKEKNSEKAKKAERQWKQDRGEDTDTDDDDDYGNDEDDEEEEGGVGSITSVAESPGLARFHCTCLPLDTKCPESELNQMILSSTPDGRTQTIHILHPGSNNEYKLTILSPFHTTQSLRNSYYNTRGSECDTTIAEIK